MFKQDHIAFFVLILGLALVVGGMIMGINSTKNSNVGATYFTGAPSNSSVDVPLNGTSTLVLAQNGGRQYALLTNRDSDFVECSIGENATASQGFMITATGGTYEIYEENLFTGAIYCFADTSTSTIDIVEE